MTEAEKITAALRCLREGINAALDVLDGTAGERERKLAAVVADIPPEGIRTRDLANLMRAHGFDARAIGGLVTSRYVYASERYGPHDLLYRREC